MTALLFVAATAADPIYVAPGGSDLAPGTAAQPVQTIAHGIALATGALQPVYIAAGTYAETMNLVSGVSLYGGFDPAQGWTRDVTTLLSIIAGAATAVVGDNDHDLALDGLVIRSANAGPGGSSVGVWLATCHDITLVRCRVETGSGGAGTTGPVGSAGSIGGDGTIGKAGCENGTLFCSTCSQPLGGAGGTSAWAMPGGAGGNAGYANGAGSFGAAGAGFGGGAGGAGGAESASGMTGGTGAPGAPGAVGAGGAAIGTFTVAGYTPASGGVGTAGSHGSGGGGGGGGGGGTTNCDSYGSSGGGGGAGGERGGGGGGGVGGGGSFGVVAVACDRISVQACAFVIAAGGHGGGGGAGGSGGAGGQPGAGGPYGGSDEQDDGGFGASGGAGGRGGDGGMGGGGGGGPTIGIVNSGAGALFVRANTFTMGAPGAGGGGPAPGASGLSAQVYGPSTTVAVDDAAPLTAAIELACAPNPFGERTRIDYALATASRVSLAVHDVRGARVALLADGPVAAGRWSAVWDGRDAGGRRVPAGVYFVRLALHDDHGERSQLRKAVMTR